MMATKNGTIRLRMSSVLAVLLGLLVSGVGVLPRAALADEPGGDDRSTRFAEDVIVFTANQSTMSRIYVLGMDGSVIIYHHYDYYIFSDVEVVNNEVYVTDWVAPRVYKVDIHTGELDVIIDDWSLFYMYDLAWDGHYFYAKEWSLNRYEFDGSWAGSTSFGEALDGSAWDGTYYWTLTDAGVIKCWDISQWPTTTEVPENAFTPPSSHCRGLWFDGQYFWTAESIESTLGYIYQFDYEGTVVNQWLEPAFRGYAACVITAVPGDLDGDGDVDLDDHARFTTCLAGPRVGMPPGGCDSTDFAHADLNNDGDVDLGDFGSFQRAFTGGSE